MPTGTEKRFGRARKAGAARRGISKHATRAGGPGHAAQKPSSVAMHVGYWDRQLGFLMHDVSRLRRTVFDRYVSPQGITRSQWWVLSYLGRHDGMTQSDLANDLELGKAALGNLLDRLEASGLIERRDDAADRRVRRVYLSQKGAGLQRKMLGLSEEMSERIIEGLDESERHKLVDLLTRVKVNLQRCLE